MEALELSKIALLEYRETIVATTKLFISPQGEVAEERSGRGQKEPPSRIRLDRSLAISLSQTISLFNNSASR